MATVVRFDSSIDLPAQYAVGTPVGVANAETDAIVVEDLEDTTVVASVAGNTQGTLYVAFTKSSLTNCTIKVYGSYLKAPTASDWYQEVVESDSSGVATLNAFSIVLTADATVVYHFPIGSYRSLKVTVASTGTPVVGSAIKLNLGLRNN